MRGYCSQYGGFWTGERNENGDECGGESRNESVFEHRDESGDESGDSSGSGSENESAVGVEMRVGMKVEMAVEMSGIEVKMDGGKSTVHSAICKNNSKLETYFSVNRTKVE